MKNISALDILVEEHKLIKRFLAVFGAMLDLMDNGKRPNIEDLQLAVEFIYDYADRYHHAKEETILFRVMESLSITDKHDQIGNLEMEHFLNRSFCSAMDDALELIENDQSDGVEAYIENARAYIALIVQHICKENHQFFPWCAKHLDEKTTLSITRQFEETMTTNFDPKLNQIWSDRVLELKEQYGESAVIIAACD